MLNSISYMFRHWSAIFESYQYLEWRVGLVLVDSLKMSLRCRNV